MLSVIEFVTFAWASMWTLLALKRVADGKRQSINFAVMVFFAFYAVPLLLDSLIGKPAFTRYPGYHLACHDETTALFYCAFVAFVPPFWYVTGTTRAPAAEGRQSLTAWGHAAIARLRPVFALFLVAPAILVALAPNRGDYLEYAHHVRQGVVLQSMDFHAMISAASLLCVLGAAGLIVASRRVGPMILLSNLPFLVLACWVNGKRYIVAYALGVLLFALWQKRVVRGLGLVLAGGGTVAAILLFSLCYQTFVRNINFGDSGWAYDNIRVDFGRDDAVKLALFAELYPTRASILEHRGQSLLFYATFYLPRSSFPDKPWPHGVYLTAGALGLRSAYPQGWTVPAGWFDEAIANLGWAGLIFGPLLFTVICRVGDGCQGELTRTLTIVLGSCLQIMQPWASSPVIALWLLSVIASRRSARLRTSPSAAGLARYGA